MTRILTIAVLLPIIAFGMWETFVYTINNTSASYKGKPITFHLIDPFNFN